jgi:hypothetical protein
MEALCSAETSVLTRGMLRNIPEEGIFYSHRRENFKSFIKWMDANSYRMSQK